MGNMPRDPRLPDKPLTTYSGSYEDIRLDVTPMESAPPLHLRKDSFITHYPLESGWLHIFLNGTDALELVPPGYLYMILVQLAAGITDLIAGRSISVAWVSDPWQMDVSRQPKHNRVLITVHSPGNNWVAMRDVSVPLYRFGKEVLNVTRKWLKYIESIYDYEVNDPEEGQPFRNSQRILKEQEAILSKYV